jgi:3-oxoadipate enol-lactonase
MMDHATMGDGCRISYRYDGPADAPIVMLSHSLGATHLMWDAQIAALSDQHRVLRYDLRGHGASDVPPGGYGLDRLGRDVIELLDTLNVDRVHFCGLSLGGMIGQWLGYRAPERLNSLTLANTSAFMGPPSGWDERITAVRTGGMAAIRDAVLARWFTADFSETGTVAAMIDATDPIGYAGCSAAIRDMDMRTTSALIAAPTFIVGGLRDPATPPEHALALHTTIAGSQMIMLDAAHLSNIEQADAFNAALLAFIAARGDRL